jgi:hypothetical protein
MSDPKHWLDEGGGATFEERELLRAARGRQMPAALRSSVWGGIAAGIATIETAVAAGAAAGSAAKQGALAKGAFGWLSGSAAAKGVAAIAIAGGIGAGAMALGSSTGSRGPATVDIAHAEKLLSRPPPSPVNGESAPPETPSELAAKPSPEGARATSESAKQRALRATAPGARTITSPTITRRAEIELPAPETQDARRATRLAAEAAAVVAIRRTLVSGRPQDALRRLEQARVEFPDGALAQEREALTVRALWQADQKDAARSRGEAFLRVFPRSPQAAELRALLEH